ncbi:MAG: hypothetical protein CMG07_05140 [Candidatus Marinimicrobia bacterium]|nr:hypothetical protein [Candidatus Neomarinimicrobiota bacterium]
MKKLFFLYICSFLYSNGLGINLSLIGHLPRGEFKEELKNDQGNIANGYGFDINAMYYVNDNFAIGINGGNSIYGNNRRSIPFNYFTDLITITEETKNAISYGHLFFKVLPFQSRVKPYFEGLIGMKNLNTNTRLFNENCTDDPETDHDDCEIAESTNSSDNAFSYGLGLGFEVVLIESSSSNLLDSIDKISDEEFAGELSFLFSFRYLYGDEAQYLKEGSIEFSNPEDGPVQTSFNYSNSKTDLIQINIGLKVKF